MLSVDININRLRLLRGVEKAGKVQIYSADTRTLDAGCVEDGRVKDPMMIAGEINDILTKNKIVEKEVICSISSSAIIYKEMYMMKPPQLEGSEILLENQIGQQMGVTINYKITYLILSEETTEEGTQMLKLAATACPLDIIEGYKALFKQAGLKLKQLVVANNNITRLINRNAEFYEENMPLLLLQVTDQFINVNIYDHGELKLSRFTNISQDDYDEGADYVGLAIFDNLFHIIHFFEQSQNVEEPRKIKTIQFYGAVDEKDSLIKAIEQFGIPVSQFERPKDVTVSLTVDFLDYAAIMGSFYEVVHGKENMNFLDTIEERTKKMNNKFFIRAACVAAVAVVLVAITWGILTFIDSGKQSKLEEQRGVLTGLDYEGTMLNVAERNKKIEWYSVYLDKIELSKGLFDFQPRFVKNVVQKIDDIRELPEFTDEEGNPIIEYKDKFNIQGYEVKINFRTNSPYKVTDFVKALEAQGYFEAIEYHGYTAENVITEGAPVVTEPPMEVLYDEEGNPIGEAPIVTEATTPVEIDVVGDYTIELTMRLKGGNTVEFK